MYCYYLQLNMTKLNSVWIPWTNDPIALKANIKKSVFCVCWGHVMLDSSVSSWIICEQCRVLIRMATTFVALLFLFIDVFLFR